MKIFVRTKDELKPMEHEAIRGEEVGEYYYVHLCPQSIVKYPIRNIFSVMIEKWLPEARNTPSAMSVEVHRLSSAEPIVFQADETFATDHFFGMTLPSTVVCLIPSADIKAVKEQLRKPEMPVSGPLEVAPARPRGSVPHESSSEDEDEATSVQATPPVLRIEQTEKQAPYVRDFEALQLLIPSVVEDLTDPRTQCEPYHLLRLCEEAITNGARYPSDKMNRWLGFIVGVLSYYQVPYDVLSKGAIEKGAGIASDAQRVVMKSLIERYHLVAKGTDSMVRMDCGLALANLSDSSLEALSYKLGYVQGRLAAGGHIMVQAEREYTRPYLHSLHQQEIPSFPAR